MPQRQINVRLAEEDAIVLEAGSFLEGQALPDLVRETLLARVSALKGDPRVAQMVQFRAEKAAEKAGEDAGVVSSLESRRRKGRPTNGNPA